MSKRFLTSILIVCVLLGICIWEQAMVDNYLNDIYNKALQIQEYVEEKETVKDDKLMQMVEEMDEAWKNYEKMFCFVINHKDIDDLSVEIARLRANIESDQAQDFKSGVNVIIHYTQSYHHIMGASLQNIL